MMAVELCYRFMYNDPEDVVIINEKESIDTGGSFESFGIHGF